MLCQERLFILQGKCQTCNISPLTDWNVCNVMLCPERLFTIVPNISHIVTFVTFYIWEAFYICSQHLSERFVLWHCESHHLPHAFISNFVFCALFQDFYLHFLFHLCKVFFWQLLWVLNICPSASVMTLWKRPSAASQSSNKHCW